ncbi:alpha/beta fold hydrolase [Actinoplanes aureus]|uniref:Alpha/beta fold hydrolase n=1 Tax=Actinoplanes aureus TaxID=2792083 RepID=A0A931C520_9ACTN|nr:alpha/beta fold hydrolase [Actinoplanes aureus]MBG0562369.1 alpha/beta fold hydrolase [Actinoplanes aureus]
MKTIVRILLAVLLALAGTVATTGTAASAAQLPGFVLSSSAAALPAELSPLATGRRVQYVSTNVNGGLITATGLVLTPKTGKQNKIVAWGHGTTGLADKCAPSTNQGVFWEEARIAVAELLSRGWTVAAPDYPGLGTPQPHPYLIGASEGRSLIDSVKAARNLDSALSTQYVVDGHSQGGQGALFASQLAPSYDGNLVLRGTASIAPLSNADVLAPFIPGTPAQGYFVMALYGVNAVEPTFQPFTYLAAPAEARVGVLQTGCLFEILDAYDELTAAQLVNGGVVPGAVLNKFRQYLNPGQTSPSAPVLIVHGTADEAVPFFLSEDYLVPQLKQQYPSLSVEFVPIPGANHDQAVIQSADLVADWIAARLA